LLVLHALHNILYKQFSLRCIAYVACVKSYTSLLALRCVRKGGNRALGIKEAFNYGYD